LKEHTCEGSTEHSVLIWKTNKWKIDNKMFNMNADPRPILRCPFCGVKLDDQDKNLILEYKEE
jgi:hypothetical protein